MAVKPIRNNLVLELHIPDFESARKFYALLGFTELSYDPTSGGGSDLGYLVLVRRDPIGDTMINFYGDKPKVSEHAHFKDYPADTPRGYAVEITCVVSDVEKMWAEVLPKLKPENISEKLITKRWGKKDFRLIDPFGFYIRFTELVDWGQT